MQFFNQDFRREVAERGPLVVALVAANLVPLGGVYYLGWKVFDVVFLYWVENVFIGVLNVLKILTCWPDSALVAERLQEQIDAKPLGQDREELYQELERLRTTSGKVAQIGWQASKLFVTPFFAFFYGFFCLVHGLFVFDLFNEDALNKADEFFLPLKSTVQELSRPGILLCALALAGSHLASFFINFIGRREFRRTTPIQQVGRPILRVVMLHFALILSFVPVSMAGSPVWLLVPLVVVKTWIDLIRHLIEHKEAPGSILDTGAMID